jgi:hypothetical protein
MPGFMDTERAIKNGPAVAGHDQPTFRERVLELLRSAPGPWQRAAIAAALQIKPVQVDQAMDELLELRAAERIGRGQYRALEGGSSVDAPREAVQFWATRPA